MAVTETQTERRAGAAARVSRFFYRHPWTKLLVLLLPAVLWLLVLYLGSIGGPAARLAQDCIRKVEVLEYPELGMEAVWRIEVEDFPAFIVVDDKGHDFFDLVSTPVSLS